MGGPSPGGRWHDQSCRPFASQTEKNADFGKESLQSVNGFMEVVSTYSISKIKIISIHNTRSVRDSPPTEAVLVHTLSSFPPLDGNWVLSYKRSRRCVISLKIKLQSSLQCEA